MNKKTLVLGASLNLGRYSNIATQRLLKHNFDVVAIGNQEGWIETVRINTKKISFKEIHTITLYLNPKNQEYYYQYIISLQPKRVIFNPGTENFELYRLLKKHQINFEIACTLVLLSTNQY